MLDILEDDMELTFFSIGIILLRFFSFILLNESFEINNVSVCVCVFLIHLDALVMSSTFLVSTS